MLEFSIFISRNSEDVKELRDVCNSKNWSLVSTSLIEFYERQIILPLNWDVIFFPSPRAVSFFFNQFKDINLSEKKIACAGKETASSLQRFVEKIDFIPENSGIISDVQRDFRKWVGDRKVVYIGSNQAKKSVLVGIPASQYEFVLAYETRFKPEAIMNCSCYVFSSPSNVESFFLLNQIPDGAIVISWGQSTTSELAKKQIKPTIELKSGNQSELITYLTK